MSSVSNPSASSSTEDAALSSSSSSSLSPEAAIEASRTYYESLRIENKSENIKMLRSLHEANKKNLKSDVKLATAFVKKAQAITDDNIAESMVKDIKTKINLSKFVGEIQNAIGKAAVRLNDIQPIGKVCNAMHQSYDEFTDPLMKDLEEQFDATFKIKSEEENDQIVNRRRILLRLISELVLIGIVPPDSAQIILRCIRKVVNQASTLMQTAKPPEILKNISVVVTFTKGCKDLFQKSESQNDSAIEFPQLFLDRLDNLLKTYMTIAFEVRSKLHNGLRTLAKRNQEEEIARGSLSEKSAEIFTQRQTYFDTVSQSILQFAELLGQQPPALQSIQEETKKIEEEIGLSILSTRKQKDIGLSAEAYVFGDEEIRSFYQDIPQLELIHPSMLLIDGAQPHIRQYLQKNGKLATDSNIASANESASASSSTTTTQKPSKDSEMAFDINAADASNAGDDNIDEAEYEKFLNESNEKSDFTLSPNFDKVDEFLLDIRNMLSVEAVDKKADAFPPINSKKARAKLVNELYHAPWSNTDLLPYYGRLVSILSRVYVDIGPSLMELLMKEFHGLLKFKKQDKSRYMSRIKNVKYIGEMVKFGLSNEYVGAPVGEFFHVLSLLFKNFTGYNIDCACALLECAGREMYRTPSTHLRCKQALEIMMRHRRVQRLTPNEELAIDNAYHHCIPPANEEVSRVKKVRSDVELYIRYVFIKINSIELSVNQLRKLDWEPENYQNTCDMVVRCAISSRKHNMKVITSVCQKIIALSEYFPRVASQFLDDLLENIELGLERNDHRHSQRRLGEMMILGQLFIDKVASLNTIFDVLFLTINHGHALPWPSHRESENSSLTTAASSNSSEVDEAAQEQMRIHQRLRRLRGEVHGGCGEKDASDFHPLVPFANDPSHDCFRIRLVCTLLDVCAKHLVKPPFIILKTDRFFAYFERYILCKKYVPRDVDFMVMDVIDSLTTHAKKYKTRSVPLTTKKGTVIPVAGFLLCNRPMTLEQAETRIASVNADARFMKLRESHAEKYVKSLKNTIEMKAQKRESAKASNQDNEKIENEINAESSSSSSDDDNEVSDNEEDKESDSVNNDEKGDENIDENKPSQTGDAEQTMSNGENESNDGSESSHSSSESSSSGGDEDDDSEGSEDGEGSESNENGDQDSDDADSNNSSSSDNEEEDASKKVEKKPKSAEDELFDLEYAKFMKDMLISSSGGRGSKAAKRAADVDSMAIPPQQLRTAIASASTASNGINTDQDKKMVKFHLIKKSAKGKIEAKGILIPEDDSIVRAVQKSEQVCYIL